MPPNCGSVRAVADQPAKFGELIAGDDLCEQRFAVGDNTFSSLPGPHAVGERKPQMLLEVPVELRFLLYLEGRRDCRGVIVAVDPYHRSRWPAGILPDLNMLDRQPPRPLRPRPLIFPPTAHRRYDESLKSPSLSAVEIKITEFWKSREMALTTECAWVLRSERGACLSDQLLGIGWNEIRTDSALPLELAEQVSRIIVLPSDKCLLHRVPGGFKIGDQHPVGSS